MSPNLVSRQKWHGWQSYPKVAQLFAWRKCESWTCLVVTMTTLS